MELFVDIAIIIALLAFAIGWGYIVRTLMRVGNRLTTTLDRADELTVSSTAVVKDIEPSVKKWSITSEAVHDEVVEPLINTARSFANFFPKKKTSPKTRSRASE